MSSSHYYEIRIRGHLPDHWSQWFDGLEVVAEADGSTTLRGHLADQAALQGVLLQVFNLGLALIAVVPGVEGAESD